MYILFVYVAEGLLEQSSLLHPSQASAHSDSGGSMRPRVPSFYIRQMSEAKLLIKSEEIKLLDCIGQGATSNSY